MADPRKLGEAFPTDSKEGVADQLVISIPTVKRHISNIYAKLGVKTRTQAVALAHEIKLVE